MDSTKVCPVCKTNRHINRYRKDKRCRDGLKTICKDCESTGKLRQRKIIKDGIIE